MRRSGQKKLVKRTNSGDFGVKRHAAWGMLVIVSAIRKFGMIFSISDTRLTATGTATKVAEDTRHSTGKNGSFDLRLVKQPNGNYDIEVFMKLQFFFHDGDPQAQGWASAAAVKWTNAQKISFMMHWHRAVRKAWNVQNAGKLSDGGQLSIQFNFKIMEAGLMWDHFEIGVTKIPQSGFAQSYVMQALIDADVKLDSNDLKPKTTGQLAAVHEFGHMIGLPDEYKKNSPHVHDHSSIMHAGTQVRKRQYTYLVGWADSNK